MDITINSKWTTDCCGKQDLDFSIISCETRYWPDKSAKCAIIFLDDYIRNNKIDEPSTVNSWFEKTTLIESDYIYGDSELEVKNKVKKWYNDNVLLAFEKAIDIIKNERISEINRAH